MSNFKEMINSGHIFTKEELVGYLKLLQPSGYTLNNDLFYVKREVGKTITLSYGIKENYPFDATFGGVGVSVRFDAVEQIFYEVFQHYHTGMPYGLDKEWDTFHTGFREDIIGQEGYYFLLDNSVWNEASFYANKPYLDQMMQAALKFVDQHQTLQDYYEMAESMPIREMARFYRQPLPERRMIVKKLLNAADYDWYAQDIVDHYNDTEPGTPQANLVVALKTYLDNL